MIPFSFLGPTELSFLTAAAVGFRGRHVSATGSHDAVRAAGAGARAPRARPPKDPDSFT